MKLSNKIIAFISLSFIAIIIFIILVVKLTEKNESDKSLSKNDTSIESSQGSNKKIDIIGIIVLIIVIIVIIAILLFSFVITIKRYEFAGQAIKSGNSGLAVLALSPEIGQGVGSLAQGIGNAIRG